MATIKDNNGVVVGELTTISKYFRKEGETLSDFNAQCKALTTADKTELAVGAAKEMGWTVSE